MQLHELKRQHPNKKSRQIGRGGKRGTTSGRGTKGQVARAGHKLRPELRDIIKKLPKRRGRGKNSNLPVGNKAVTITLAVLEKNFGSGATVTPFALLEKKLIRPRAGRLPQVKILVGGLSAGQAGKLTKKLTISNCAISAGARAAVEKAGGNVNDHVK